MSTQIGGLTLDTTGGIFLKTGYVSGASDIIQKERRAMARAVEKGMQLTVSLYLPTVAMYSGKMREKLKDVLYNIVFSAAILSTGYFEITPQKIKSMMDSLVDYFKYHWMASPIGLSSYKHPTTAGTHPVEPDSMLNILSDYIKTQLPIELRKEGLDIR